MSVWNDGFVQYFDPLASVDLVADGHVELTAVGKMLFVGRPDQNRIEIYDWDQDTKSFQLFDSIFGSWLFTNDAAIVPASFGENFRVSDDGRTLIVGDPGANANPDPSGQSAGNAAGAVSIWTRSDDGYVRDAGIYGQTLDRVGLRVDISADENAFVYCSGSFGLGGEVIAVYGGVEQKLIDPVPDVIDGTFGATVAISETGDRLAVYHSGDRAVYLYTRINGFFEPDTSLNSNARYDLSFIAETGAEISIDFDRTGSVLVIGSPDAGKVIRFELDDTIRSGIAVKQEIADPEPGGRFGADVRVSADGQRVAIADPANKEAWIWELDPVNDKDSPLVRIDTPDVDADRFAFDRDTGSIAAVLDVDRDGIQFSAATFAASSLQIRDTDAPLDVGLLGFELPEGGTAIVGDGVVISGDPNGAVSIENGRLLVDPSAYASLLAGESQQVEVRWSVVDEANVTRVQRELSIVIEGENQQPDAVGRTFQINEDQPTEVSILDLINDPDGPTETYIYRLVTMPTHGSAVVSANQSDPLLGFRPAFDYFGPDSLQILVTDAGVETLVTIPIEVLPVNDAPRVTELPTFQAIEDNELVGSLAFSATDPEGQTVSYSVDAASGNGSTLDLQRDGSFTYFPASNFNGSDIFTVAASDGASETLFEVRFDVAPVADNPIAEPDNFTIAEDTNLNLNFLTRNDVDPDGMVGDQMIEIVSDVPNGTIETINGRLHFVPELNFFGTTSFEYVYSVGGRSSNPALATITVTPVSDFAPIAKGDSYNDAVEDSDFVSAVSILENDTDADNETGQFEERRFAELVDGPDPAEGEIIAFNSDTGEFTVRPAADFNGPLTFTYRTGDGTFFSAPATVTVDFAAVNDAPVAMDSVVNLSEDIGGSFASVLSNVNDVDQDLLTVRLVDTVSNGTLALRPDGTFDYIPDTNFWGTDSFTYEVTDGQLSDTATVTLQVTGVSDFAPVANDDIYDNAVEDEIYVASISILSNDTDQDNDTSASSELKVAELVQRPDRTQGEIVSFDGASGLFTLRPADNFNGSLTFTYRVFDGTFLSDPATITVDFAPVNDAPAATNAFVSLPEDTSASGAVLDNVIDVDGDDLTVTLVSDVSHGALSLRSDGAFIYTPVADYWGEDRFTYEVTDGNASDQATIFFDVTPVSDFDPIAVDDSYTTSEDTPLDARTSVLANDSDDDGTRLLAVLKTGPSHGTLQLSLDGTFVYTPDENYAGPDSFTYAVQSELQESAPATVSLVVEPVNDAPDTTPDTYLVAPGGTIRANVLDNDSDVEGDGLSVVFFNSQVQGTVIDGSGGRFEYTAPDGFIGVDEFLYLASDGTSSSVPTLVTIIVNDVPVANPDAYTVIEDGFRSVTPSAGVLANDTDSSGTLTAILVDGPVNGILDKGLAPNGSFFYLPSEDFFGIDTFTYRVFDGLSESAVQTVTLTVSPIDDAPELQPDSLSTDEDVPLLIDPAILTANDVDIDDPLVIDSVANAINGSVDFVDGQILFTPASDFSGTAYFDYKVVSSGAITARVTVDVAPVNDAPVALPDTYGVTEDVVRNVDAISGVLSNDKDVDKDQLTAVLISGPSNGTLDFRDDGSFDYTPNLDFFGEDRFEYAAFDGTAQSAPVAITLRVTGVDDAPVIGDDSFIATEDVPLNLALLANDSDPDGDALQISGFSAVIGATLSLQGDGTVLFTPDENVIEDIAFTYTVTDGTSFVIGNVDVTITPVNDAPVANDDVAVGQEDTPIDVAVLLNDTDVDVGDSLRIAAVGLPAHGSAHVSEDGIIRYTPNTDYNGLDSFTYTVIDSAGETDTATVEVYLAPVNDPPIAINDSTFVYEDGRTLDLRTLLLANDSDIEGDTLTVMSVDTTGTLGTVLFDADAQTLVFVADDPTLDALKPGETVVTAFTYTIGDGNDGTATAQVDITIGGVIEPNRNGQLVGGGGDNVLQGTEANEFLNGGGGADLINSGPGNDRIIGGGGPDTFVIDPGADADMIFGFVSGVDVLDLRGVTGVSTHAEAFAFLDDTNDGLIDARDAIGTAGQNGLLLDFGDGDSVLLIGVLALRSDDLGNHWEL